MSINSRKMSLESENVRHLLSASDLFDYRSYLKIYDNGGANTVNHFSCISAIFLEMDIAKKTIEVNWADMLHYNWLEKSGRASLMKMLNLFTSASYNQRSNKNKNFTPLKTPFYARNKIDYDDIPNQAARSSRRFRSRNIEFCDFDWI